MVMGAMQKNKTGSGARNYGGGGCFLKGLPEHVRFEQRPEGRGVINRVDHISDKNVLGKGNSKYKLLQ